MMLEILIGANLLISIIGALIVGRWVYALKGTIEAQAATIATIQQVNETVVKVFMALDPERFIRHVTAYQELADRNAAAIVKDAERKFREERTAALDRMTENYGQALEIALRFMPWVSKSHRAQEIAETKLPDNVKTMLTEMADKAPEWSAGGLRGLGLLLESGGVILRE